MNTFHKAASESDYLAYFSKFSPNVYFLRTDASEHWSLEEFKDYAKPAFDAGRGWHYEVVERNVQIKGHVAWFDEQLNNRHLGRCRGTGILIKTDNGWKVAHYSLTILVPNETADNVAAESSAIMGLNGRMRWAATVAEAKYSSSVASRSCWLFRQRKQLKRLCDLAIPLMYFV